MGFDAWLDVMGSTGENEWTFVQLARIDKLPAQAQEWLDTQMLTHSEDADMCERLLAQAEQGKLD